MNQNLLSLQNILTFIDDHRELVKDFEAKLWHPMIHCDFGAHLGKVLRDCFVCGLTDEITQKCLLSEMELTFSGGIDIAHVTDPLLRMSESYKVHKCQVIFIS